MKDEYPLVLWPGDPKPPSRFRFSLKALIVAMTLVSFWAARSLSIGRGEKFDRDAWNDPVQVENNVRMRMGDGLVRRGDLLGRPKAEVLGLLGAPLSPTFGQYPNVLHFSLGKDPWWIIGGHKKLSITFDDEDDRVREVYIFHQPDF